MYPLGVVQSGSIGPETVPLTSTKSNVVVVASTVNVRWSGVKVDER
jgi:hypothetical protein